MQQPHPPLAIPLWINGHAFLTMAPSFIEVCNPLNGKVLRRTPECGTAEVEKAVSAAQAALAPWRILTLAERAFLLAAVADALAGYTNHFAALITEETGLGSTVAEAEVLASIALLRQQEERKSLGDDITVIGIIGNSNSPLLSSLQHAVPALLAGATLVLRPAPQTPSALFALAELSTRCGFPNGVFNIVHGGEAMIDGLRAALGDKLLRA